MDLFKKIREIQDEKCLRDEDMVLLLCINLQILDSTFLTRHGEKIVAELACPKS
jgi:hypothetical protein